MLDRFFARGFAPAVASILAVALSTAIVRIVDARFEPQHLVFAYLVPIAFIAFRFGTVPATLTALASAGCAGFFVYPPKFSLYIAKPLHVAELMFFVVLAVATTQFIAVLADEKRRGTAPQRASANENDAINRAPPATR
jgi:K+-sensing histidine kinase KdpD